MFYLRCLCCPNADRTGNYEFEVPPGEPLRCPKCESTLDSGRIEQLALIHFEPPYSPELRGRRGSGKLACTGATSRSVTGEYRLVTSSARAVNCPDCLLTVEYDDEARASAYAMNEEQRGRLNRMIERTVLGVTGLKSQGVQPCQTSEAICPEPTTPLTTAPLSDQPLTAGDSNKA